jgi:hypothetical protein
MPLSAPMCAVPFCGDSSARAPSTTTFSLLYMTCGVAAFACNPSSVFSFEAMIIAARCMQARRQRGKEEIRTRSGRTERGLYVTSLRQSRGPARISMYGEMELLESKAGGYSAHTNCAPGSVGHAALPRRRNNIAQGCASRWLVVAGAGEASQSAM